MICVNKSRKMSTGIWKMVYKLAETIKMRAIIGKIATENNAGNFSKMYKNMSEETVKRARKIPRNSFENHKVT